MDISAEMLAWGRDLPETATYHAVLVLEPADDEAGRELCSRLDRP